jgi:hypothetical protein
MLNRKSTQWAVLLYRGLLGTVMLTLNTPWPESAFFFFAGDIIVEGTYHLDPVRILAI